MKRSIVFPTSKKELIVEQLKKHHVQIAALIECGMLDSGISYVSNYAFIHSGASSYNETRKVHGVAICLRKHATKVWKASGLIWKTINSRIVVVRLKCKPTKVTIIAVYAPMNLINGQKEATEVFYDNLQQVANDTPKNDMLLTIGDFNARVHSNKNMMNEPIGPHTMDQLNENGEQLLDLRLLHDPLIASTFYRRRAIHKCTWMHPGNIQ